VETAVCGVWWTLRGEGFIWYWGSGNCSLGCVVDGEGRGIYMVLGEWKLQFVWWGVWRTVRGEGFILYWGSGNCSLWCVVDAEGRGIYNFTVYSRTVLTVITHSFCYKFSCTTAEKL
jgi:hypothetical protein